MNKRIRKKKDKQQLAWTIRELVAIAEEREQKKQAAIKRIVDAYGAYYEQQRAQMVLPYLRLSLSTEP